MRIVSALVLFASLATGIAGALALRAHHRSALAGLAGEAAARLPGIAERVGGLSARALEAARATLGPGPWRAGVALEESCLDLTESDALVAAVWVLGPDGALLSPAAIAPVEPPATRARPPAVPVGRAAANAGPAGARSPRSAALRPALGSRSSTPSQAAEPGPEELLQRARRSSAAEARDLLDRLERLHGARPAPGGGDWAGVVEDERLALASRLGRHAEVYERGRRGVERRSSGPEAAAPATAAAWVERLLATPAASVLLPGERGALEALAAEQATRATRLATRQGERAAWDAAAVRAPPTGGSFDWAGRPLLASPAGPHGTLVVALDATEVRRLLVALVDDLQGRDGPLWLLDGAGPVAGATGGPPRDAAVVALAPPFAGLRLATAAPGSAYVAVIRRTRWLAGALVAMVLALAGAGWVAARGAAERVRLEGLRADFVASVSHDLKTPIASIRALAETLAEGRAPGKGEAYARTILRDAARLDRMVRRILAFPRASRRSPRPQPAPTDLADVVREAVQEFGRGDDAPIRLVLGETPAPCLLDRDAVGEAIWNLLDNAVRYSESGSTITVAVGVESRFGRVSVADRGVGIPAAERARVFEPWFRGSHPRVRAAGGTGLGLARVRQVAEDHGGRVEIDSLEGQGTVVTLCFPCVGARA
ncbi:MAG: HAMP domain-containing histidine kinase [Planctomycetes bacterium]|nr:HAMP domain-containing histidine kinase [Planctomycetota bacterium]